MSTILILTRAWPYAPGEQFVDAEARHWGILAERGVRVVVMPWRAEGEPRAEVPAGVDIDLSLARATAADRRRALVKGLFSSAFVAELPGVIRHPSRLRAVEVANAVRGASLTAEFLQAWSQQNGQIDLVYSYWFDVFALGALQLKKRGVVSAVVSRVHGYDLHESRHPARYHALKRQLAPRLDALLPVSRSGGELASTTFKINSRRVHHAPLGIEMAAQLTPASDDGVLRLVTVASALPVKRLDRMVDAIRLLGQRRGDLSLQWTHLGGGALLDELKQRAADVSSNVTIDWRGQVSPSEVEEFYRSQVVDLIVNCSESEGVPVSLMEAMSHAIPALAPAVGAIAELVPADGLGGELLPAELTPELLADALERWTTRAGDPEQRAAAHEIVAARHDATETTAELTEIFCQLSPAIARDLGKAR